ncbi:pyridoxal-phosphate dependent enzyme [Hydrogenimonas urashimensis]|uniref:pyridoxal-phosphate dependent enzyme n=1 Tax=Hydrogenimonas urashimensis TaxID=2740515 RepID=UPI001915ECC5|nr:pyridoxal-phosphate dependent enzyme [Hydrogenimonas urashimensis]
MDRLTIDGRLFYVKRDDLTDPRYSGNKLRKLSALLTLSPKRYTTIVSYGGAQSNAMLSIAYLAQAKGWDFHYYCKMLPSWLRSRPTGNLAAALALGMQLHEVQTQRFYPLVSDVARACGEDALFIPQGGADPIAEEGIATLAREIRAWKDETKLPRLTVATPSGTGTTALYLRKNLPPDIDVVTVPVVGDAEVLRAQWRELEPDMSAYPSVLDRRGKWPFAKPNRAYYAIWQRLGKAGVEFDLIYAPKTWLELLDAYENLTQPILYIHSGGVSGNVSQLENYRHKGMLDG